MAGKARNNINRLETEIEKSREDSNWKRVIELAEQLKTRSKKDECLSNFLIGEGRLESYLELKQPTEENQGKAKTGLSEAKKYLLEAANDLGKKAGVALDAHLLLGKLCYACGLYEESLEHYSQAELHTLTEKHLPIRSLRIVAESFAIKALCLEKVDHPGLSRFKLAERESEMMRCFELGSDLSLLYLQEVDKLNNLNQGTISGSHSPQPVVTTATTNTISSTSTLQQQQQQYSNNQKQHQMGLIMETALKRTPLLYISSGKIASAVERYRAVLTAVETTSTNELRLACTRQLAEVLLRGVTGNSYVTPDKPPLHSGKRTTVSTSSIAVAAVASGMGTVPALPGDTPWKPRRYVALNQFVPKNENEEIVLLLLISEAMAVHNAVLSQSPEFKEARIRAFQDATCVYDLLALATVRWGQSELLYESFERAMKFSFEEPHIWQQQALCLVTMGRYTHALEVLKEVHRLQPNATAPCLLAAKICYENMNLPDLGLKWSKRALKIEENATASPSLLIGRCHIYVGIGYQMKASNAQLKNEKNQFNEQAAHHFQTAVNEDSNDHLGEYYWALQLAIMSRVSEALVHVRVSLSLRPEGSAALQLLALLLSASRQHHEALQLVNTALDEYPDCLNLMHVKAHLELHENGGEQALVTAKKMLQLWKSQYENLTINDAPECDRKSDTRSVFQLYTSEMSDKDSSSLQAHSVAASRVEQALSEAASSLSSFSPQRPGPQRAWQLLLQIWLLLAELYLSIEQILSAQECVKRAAEIFPLSHHIMYMRGLIHVYKEEWNEAKLCFQNSVAVNPRHIKSLQQLGLIYHYLGSQRVAETTLRDACKIDPTSHQTWYILGSVLEALEEHDNAAQCMAVALSEEMCSPVLPFTSVPLCFE